ncbi:DNA ligase D [Sphingomonas profundi]|uniref:DNA ligase D n=1 Tax=Alterirhizorhabdus profundi TaxID=2681549 RepID=UPI0012E79809|nr:DNA ligase D [Sphingomonas profundi]
MSDPLATYNAKRDFAKTAEPAGKRGTAAGNIFMVQKHDATRLHWDFRLELEGVLKSWAVTRGPSLNPEDKRLAVRTEDHPMDYATFEGSIPKGQYGGGTVMLWDRGTWTPHPGKDPVKTLAEGHLHFTLDGERMKGEWIMIRLKPRGREKNENWLLRKVADAHQGGSDDLVERALTSVATGRTMTEIADGAPAKTRETGAKPRKATRKPAAATPAGKPRAKPLKAQPLPAFAAPQLATLVDHVPPGGDWLHEVKYDGYRCLLAIAGDKAKAYTRTGLDWSDRFAPIVQAATALGIGSALIDGEVVALDRDGRPSFQTLQAALKEGSAPLTFFAFDLLEENGQDLSPLPNRERKARLATLLEGVSEPIRYADHIAGEGEKLFNTLCAAGYEGVISKRADAPYRGRRSQNWLKIKCIRRQEFVVVGWTPSEKGRGFRSLLLGLNEDGRLRYAGKVGTGFDAAGIETLMAKLTPLERETATVEAPRAAVRGAHWVEPSLVAEVAFAEMTHDGVLRHSSFVGLREDKPAADVVKEAPVAAPKPKRAKAAAKPDEKPFGIAISSRERVIFPESGITKGELADYYAIVAEPMLGWLADRPVSLVRCPQGRAKHCFFQKHDAGSFGDTVRKVPIREKDGHDEPYLYVDDGAGLLACVQMGTIEFHGWGSKVADVEMVDRLVFDLDPDEGLGFPAVKRAALFLRGVLADIGLVTFPMLSGGKGVHVVAPLDATADWVAVKDFASRFSKALGQAHGDMFTANMKKTERKGRIFLDWLRNQRGATAVLPYSARARANAPVAAPITWEELEETESPARFTIRDAAELVKRARGRNLKGWGVARQALPPL